MLGIITTTLIILIFLILAGEKQISYYKIPFNKLGAAAGISVGLLAGGIAVKASGNFGDYLNGNLTLLAGVGSVIACGYLAGRTAGIIMSVIAICVSSVGVYIAASLTPYFELDQFPVLMTHSLGSFIWGILLAVLLSYIFSNTQKFKDFI